ncbi:5736_t:CDS:1, partial [Paraglomus brasilianum]
GHSMDPNYTNSLPWDQVHGTDPNYANRFPPDQIISTALTASYSYQPPSQASPQPPSQASPQPPSQASPQPPSQAFSFSNTRPLDQNSIRLGVNEPLNYRYVENNEDRVNYLTRNHKLNNHREPSIRCPISQTSGQTQSTTTTFSSSASMITIAT